MSRSATDPRFPRVLVTGATGFLGQPLIERLVETGRQITAIGRRVKNTPFVSAVEYLSGDLSDRRFVSSILYPWRWDAIINLARPRSEEGPQMLCDQVGMAANVCMSIPKDWPGRFIHASSMTVYGMPEKLPVDEFHPLRPVHPYGTAKLLAETILRTAIEQSDGDLWLLRFPGLFSETRKNGAVFHFMHAAAEGRPLTLSAAERTPWDVLHVMDAVESILRSLVSVERNPGEINIGYGEPVELEAMARKISAMFDSCAPVYNRAAVEHPIFQMDIKKARRMLDWPPGTLDDRLAAMRQLFPSGIPTA